jgi:hypothetical protein
MGESWEVPYSTLDLSDHGPSSNLLITVMPEREIIP